MTPLRSKICKSLTRSISMELVDLCNKKNISVAYATPLITDVHCGLFLFEHDVVRVLEETDTFKSLFS